MLKNFFYSKAVYLGKEHHTLKYLDPQKIGMEFSPLGIYLRALIKEGKHFQTIRATGPRIANFTDYFLEGLNYIQCTKTEINDLYFQYHSYLTRGNSSSSEIVRKICEVKPSPEIGVESSRQYHNSINPFLKKLKEIKETYLEHVANGITSEQPETSLLIDCMIKIEPKIVAIHPSEQAAIRQYATPMTAGTGIKTSRASFVSHIPHLDGFEKPLDDDKIFPLDKISALIENASSYRDACLYASIAATNARDSEADQLLWSDIKLKTREILLLNPNERRDQKLAYRGINEIEFNKLEWKGRGTPFTVLLEPYGDLFFKNLLLYLKHEYNPACGHNFVFHSKDLKPLYLCDYSSVILHPFKQAAARTLPNQPHLVRRLGLHSLRHSNIYFWKNYLEHSLGLGLSDSELILLTGHIDIRSLRKYARADREILLEKISFANHLRKNGTIKSDLEFKIKYLEDRLKIFREKLNRGEKGV